MVKKIVFGILMVGLCGMLVVGAVNRTTAKTTGVEQVYRQGDGYGITELISDAGERSRGKQGSSGNNTWATTQDLDGNPEADASFSQERTVLHGVVASVEEDTLTVELLDGEEIVVKGRAWSFAQEQGFVSQVGDQVELAGYIVGEEFEVGRIENLTTDQMITLRDGNGRPQWAGRGKRGA
jgi:hypothetical protein